MPGGDVYASPYQASGLARHATIELIFDFIRLGGLDRVHEVSRRRVQGVKLHGGAARIDDVVIGAGRNNDGPIGREEMFGFAIVDDGFGFTLFKSDELVQPVHFVPDLLAGFKAHEDELGVMGGEDHPTVVVVFHGYLLKIRDKGFHPGILSDIVRAPSRRSGGMVGRSPTGM